jgi:diguanylate cyclase (GGDEF)-like protein
MNKKSEFSLYHNINITLTLLLLWNVLVWVLSDNFYLSKAKEMIKQESSFSQERADDLGDSITRNLNYLHGIPDMFSELLRVKWAVTKFGGSQVPSPLSKEERVKKWASDKALEDLNRYLDFSARSLRVDMLYVVNAAGDLIAASNWESNSSSIGITVAERSYFKQNKAGHHSVQYAVGKTTKIPGLFFSTPIFIDGKFMGSVVAKADVPNLSFLTKQMNAFVVDDNGIVILARNKELEMSSLPDAAISKLSQQEKSVLYLRDNFPTLKIEPWGDKNLPSLVRVQNNQNPHLLVSKRIPEYNLTVFVDSELAEIPALSRDYFWFTLLVSALGSVLILIINGAFIYFLSIKNSKALLWNQANFDSLSGLPNRDLLRDRLAQEIKKSDRSKLPLALILIDLDQFKEVNDSLGHDMGDVLLKEAATRIQNCVRDSDTVARLGGDEFTVLIPQLANTCHVDDIAQKINTSLAEPFYLRNEVIQISASLGITLYPGDANNIDDLMKHADQAMYVAKKDGRNRYSHFTQALQDGAQKRLRLIRDLRNALPNQQFKVYFQPIVKLSSGKVHKAEALLRWLHPEHGMISPADFIPLAEESRLILEIGAWVRMESAAWCKRWNEICTEPFQVSVNKSPVEFMDDSAITSVAGFVDYLRDINMTGESFVFEITEGMLLNLSSNVSNKLLALRDAGIQVSLDDFGTGYSSLSYLMKLDIDYLKIDKSFVCNLEPESDDLILCEAIISMAHKLGLKVIAEGVETEQQRNLLLLANCDYAQGYFYSRPIPPEDFEVWMKDINNYSLAL